MCLYTKQFGPIRAKKDIVCYKVVTVNKRGVYRTPFTGDRIGTTLNGLEFRADGNKKTFSPRLYDAEWMSKIYIYSIYEGAIHSYKTLEEAKLMCEYGNLDKPKIFECIIPRGTEYYDGNAAANGCGPACYASEKIKFIKEIK